MPTRSLNEVHAMMTAPGAMWETEEKVVNGRRLKVYKGTHQSLRDFWKWTEMFGPREYIVYEQERITYAQAHERVKLFANLLHRTGIRKGDRVSVLMRNIPEWLYLFWACHTIGAVVVAVNAWAPLESILHCVSLSDSKALFVDEERMEVVKNSLSDLRKFGCNSCFVARASKKLPEGFVDVAEALKGCDTSLPSVDIGPEDLATIYHTSGTTSLPKGVASTQRMFMTNRLNTTMATARATLRKGLDLPVPDPKAPQRSLLLTVPLFHVIGSHSFMQLMTSVGGKITMMRKWDVENAVDLIVKEKVSLTGGVPHMVLEIVEKLHGKDHKIEGLSFGGGPASIKLPGTVDKLLPGIPAGQGYGLTETNAVATSFTGQDYIDRPTSCGLPTPVTEIQIIDSDTGKVLPVGTTGEICIKGPQVALGYWKNEKASKECFTEDGWFKSGDVGYVDKEGFLYISDRAKDVIIRGGENIASGQIENALYTDSRVKDAAVVPVPDPKLSELVSAVVVLHPQYRGKVSEKELMEHVGKLLPKHCVPVLIVFKEEMPRNATGKTLKTDLKVELTKIWTEKQPVKAKM